jgi:hypothetical protein
MTIEEVAAETEHLKEHRQMILVRSALYAVTKSLPLPGLGDMLATALGRGLIYHVAHLRYVDIDESAVDELLAVPVKNQRLTMLSAIGGMVSLLRRRGKYGRLVAGLVVLHAMEEGSHAFHLATLFDHYCAKHHRGSAIRVEEARRLRETIDEATRSAQREAAITVIEQIVAQGLRLVKTVPVWAWAQITRTSSLPPLAAMSALRHELQSWLGNLANFGYFKHVVSNFDKKWDEGTPSP